MSIKHLIKTAVFALLLTHGPDPRMLAEDVIPVASHSGGDAGFREDDREVYILSSRIRGRWLKVGPVYHASIAICPKGVSPIVYENGTPVSNWKQCVVYGTKTGKRGFFREGKRIGVTATRVPGVSASMVERRIRSHHELNIPLLNDCRHNARGVTGLARWN